MPWQSCTSADGNHRWEKWGPGYEVSMLWQPLTFGGRLFGKPDGPPIRYSEIHQRRTCQTCGAIQERKVSGSPPA
jgi:hypothetical protein